jgi:hypothetical protein
MCTIKGGVAEWTAIPVGRIDYQIWCGERLLFTIETRVLGPGWENAEFTQYAYTEGKRRIFKDVAKFSGSRRQETKAPKNITFDFGYEVEQTKPNAFAITTHSVSQADIEAVGVAVIVSTTDFFAGGEGLVLWADGNTKKFTMPLGRGQYGNSVTGIVLNSSQKETVKITMSRPVRVTSDHGELRIWAWTDKITADKEEVTTVTFEFPQPIRFEPANRLVDMKEWFLFQPRQDFRPGSPIGAEGWLDPPAGKYGWVQMDGSSLVFEKRKTPVKFWGVNIPYTRMAVEPSLADEWADKYAKYGINFVRLHKWTGHNVWDGLMRPDDPLEFDEQRARLFDYFHAALKKRGIYVGWSPIFALRADESMKRYIPNMPEILAAIPKRSGLFADSLYPLQCFATDVQDFYIALTVRWLNRVNPFTGLRYADDPALVYVELHNEADIFFWGMGKLLRLYPTYTRQMCERFSKWLSQRYRDDAELRAAWGKDLKPNESLKAKNIFPFPDYYNDALPPSRRVVDSYTFLYEFQNEFYDRYIKAIRRTGYKGLIVASCWRGADAYADLFNLASDRRAGLIDRHRYGGMDLRRPGSGLLSAGIHHVGDRPFGLSEWAPPGIWGAQCPPAIGFIGLGLQGWDYSAQFASSSPYILTDDEGGINANCDELRTLAQYPFIARFIYSGALKEGQKVVSCRISMENLLTGNMVFGELMNVPDEAFAVGQVTVDFVDKPTDAKVDLSNLNKFWDKEKCIIRASNGQVVWDYSGRGFITVDTPVGGAVIGFGGGREHALSKMTIRYENAFANVYVVVQNPGETLANAKRLIILTLARTAFKGDVYDETGSSPLKRETAPARKRRSWDERPSESRLILEPVKATIKLHDERPFKVYALDHDGCMTAPPVEVPVKDGQFVLDGTKYRTMYYLVEFVE